MKDGLITALQKILSPDHIITGASLDERYSHIWKMNEGLQARALLIPQNTQELSGIMKICNGMKQNVVIHGGLTNLVGGTESVPSDIVISMEAFRQIEEIDSSSRSMTVQAGVTLQEIQEEARAHDLLFPLNFGAKGSAQIGGIISTNAGGLRVFRFGMTRNLVLGLEVVLADGTVISSLKRIIKDNSAYDLKQLFIGSEGSLGIITRAVLKLVERPLSRCSAFVGLNSYVDVVALLKHMDRGSAGKLSGFELIWQYTYKAMTSPPAHSRAPIPHDYQFYVLVDLMGADQEKDTALLEQLLEQAHGLNLIEDAALAYTESDLDWFWKIREDVHAFVSLCTVDQHFDVSLPIPKIGHYVAEVVEELNSHDDIEHVFPFGHVADGNVHFVVGKTNESDALRLWINDVVYNPLRSIGGSVSAEHGIGMHKKQYLPISRSDEEIALMRKIKNVLDPNGILNRGKVLP